MDIKTFTAVAKVLPPNISVCIRGAHGIGKSSLTYQIAEAMGLKPIERRLSQMSEGDMIGLPELVDGTTSFRPPDWYMMACREPCLVFLDEINRSTDEIRQAASQVVGMHSLNGHALHPETRVYTAINASSEYDVGDMDPALLDRFYVIDLEPTVEEWLEWAAVNCHEFVVDFIRSNHKMLEHDGPIEPGAVYPSRRSWKKVNDCLVAAKLIEDPNDARFYGVSVGLLGPATAAAFVDHVKKMDLHMSADDILNRWSKVQSKVKKLGNERFNILIEKLVEHSVKNTWTDRQAKNLKKFIDTMPDELKLGFWSALTDHPERTKMLENIKRAHVHLVPVLLAAVDGNDSP